MRVQAQSRFLRAIRHRGDGDPRPDPDRLFLMPGVGAQGGEAGLAIRAALDARGGGVLVSASRTVLYASRDSDFERAAAAAARSLREAANAARISATVSG